jgi:hypothetical protein
VPNDELAETFAEIPADSDVGYLRAHVAGTDEAREAVLDQSIPQTAAVKRSTTPRSASTYDGEPKFEPIEGTELSYAVNTATSVIQVGSAYYACEQGVWYLAAAPSGPWTVATKIPDEISEIPPSSPVYNVTHVHIYESTPEVVYVGYTPGYTGSYVSHSCVVYGTGWLYRPWWGSYYYARPATWGFHVGGIPGTDGASASAGRTGPSASPSGSAAGAAMAGAAGGARPDTDPMREPGTAPGIAPGIGRGTGTGVQPAPPVRRRIETRQRAATSTRDQATPTGWRRPATGPTRATERPALRRTAPTTSTPTATATCTVATTTAAGTVATAAVGPRPTACRRGETPRVPRPATVAPRPLPIEAGRPPVNRPQPGTRPSMQQPSTRPSTQQQTRPSTPSYSGGSSMNRDYNARQRGSQRSQQYHSGSRSGSRPSGATRSRGGGARRR